MDTFKFKITLDRHNDVQNLNYHDLPDPPRFSLPSTFKNAFDWHLIASMQNRYCIKSGTCAEKDYPLNLPFQYR